MFIKPKIKIFLLLFISSFVLINSQDASQNNKDNANPICIKCRCDRTKKVLDCSNKKLLNLFSNDEWKQLNDTGFVFETVNFAHNSINNVTRFPSLNIQYLDLSNNAIAMIERRAFYDLENITTLDLSFNKIDTETLVQDVFEGHYEPTEYEPLKKLRVLKLGHNGIHRLASNVFSHLDNLEELYLDENPFKVIDSTTQIAISNIAKLRVLDMSALQLRKLPEHIFHGPRTLEVLNLSANIFHHIPEALAFAYNLKELVMDENPVNNLDEFNHFPLMPKLEKLSLSYITLMQTIGPLAFDGLENLKEFYCVQNPYLKEIHEDAFSRPGKEDKSRREWPPIEKLILHNNQLTHLDAKLLAQWETVKVIDLQHNPWSCDCQNQFIVDTLIPQIIKDNEPLANNLKCAAPYQMLNQEMRNLTEKNSKLRCLDKYGNNPEGDGTILIGLLLGIVIGIPFTMLVMIIYRRGCFGFRRPRGGSDYSKAFYQRAGIYEDTMSHI